MKNFSPFQSPEMFFDFNKKHFATNLRDEQCFIV